MAFYANIFRRIVVIRPIFVLEEPREVELTKLNVLTLAGTKDPFAPHTDTLNNRLGRCGAKLEAQLVSVGHSIAPGGR